MKNTLATAALAAVMLPALSTAQTAPRPDQLEFRALYKELVETNTDLSDGNCTVAAAKMAAQLKAAGYPDADIHPFPADGHPKEGGLVAVLHGTDPKARPILLLAISTWSKPSARTGSAIRSRSIEENGYFYGRGSSDDKADGRGLGRHADPLQEGRLPAEARHEDGAHLRRGNRKRVQRRELSGATHERKLIDAAFALNEGAGGRLDANGKPLALNIEARREILRRIISSKSPIPAAIPRVRPRTTRSIIWPARSFASASMISPSQFTDASKTFFTRMAPIVGGDMGKAMLALVKDPNDAKAAAIVESDPGYNGMLHTTCVATLLSGGHATNALPQRADANINCRIFPGTSVEQVNAKLVELVGRSRSERHDARSAQRSDARRRRRSRPRSWARSRPWRPSSGRACRSFPC